VNETNQLRADFAGLLLADDPDAAAAWAQGVIETGVDPLAFYRNVFTPAMQDIGDQFGRLDIFLPELMIAAMSAKVVDERVLRPRFAQSGAGNQGRGTVLIGSVLGDLHDIGKNMVALMLQVNGFDVVDLGVNIHPKTFIDRARESGALIVGLSSLMTTSMPYMKEVIEMRDNLGLKDTFFVVVGGAPITPRYSQEIGADGFGRDALEGVAQCIALVERRQQAKE
jgi:methylmalonyl-CoA mutase cobalamin-binding domain/chain